MTSPSAGTLTIADFEKELSRSELSGYGGMRDQRPSTVTGSSQKIDVLPDSLKATPLSVTEFLKQIIAPIQYFVKHMVIKRGKTMISAATNKGKSILMMNLALAIAAKMDSILGFKVENTAKVLVIDTEMGQSALQERLKIMTQGKDLNLDNLFVKNIPDLNLLDQAQRLQLEAWIKDLGIELLIIDPLGSSWQGDENNKKEVQGVTSYLNTLIERFGIGIIVVHHWRKASEKGKSGGEMAAGSYLWTAWLDIHITLEGDINSVSVSCEKARHGGRFKPFIMRLDEETLWFEFVTNYEKKITDDTLVSLFNLAGKKEMTRKELLDFSAANHGPSRATIDRILKNSRFFEIKHDFNGKSATIRLLEDQIPELYTEEPKADWNE